MRPRLKQAALVSVVLVAAAQAYPPQKQRALLAASCRDASEGKMPGPYTLLRPETRLTAPDVETICTAAREAEARQAGGSR